MCFKTTLLVAVALVAFALPASAQLSCQQVGSNTYCNNGQTFQRIGPNIYDNNGNSWQKVGPNTYGSDGTTYQRVGPNTYDNHGNSWQRIGPDSYGSKWRDVPRHRQHDLLQLTPRWTVG